MSVQTVNKLYDYSIKCCFFQYTQIISHLIEVKNKITINLQHYIHIKFTQSSYKIHSCVCPAMLSLLIINKLSSDLISIVLSWLDAPDTILKLKEEI